jgi:hypothetical protein
VGICAMSPSLRPLMVGSSTWLCSAELETRIPAAANLGDKDDRSPEDLDRLLVVAARTTREKVAAYTISNLRLSHSHSIVPGGFDVTS